MTQESTTEQESDSYTQECDFFGSVGFVSLFVCFVLFNPASLNTTLLNFQFPKFYGSNSREDLLCVLHWLLGFSILASNPETLGKN